MSHSLCISIPAYDGRIPVETAVQMCSAVSTLQKAGVAVDIQWGAQSALIDLCRNRLVKKFLQESTTQKLLFLDSDIIFKAMDLVQLYSWSNHYPIVGATYPLRKEPVKFFINHVDGCFETNEDGLIEVGGFGAGFVIIDRSVFEKMDQFVEQIETSEGEVLKRYFDIRVVNGKYLGEDISFYRRWIEECDGSVFIDPTINLKHVGNKEFDAKLIDYLNTNLKRVI